MTASHQLFLREGRGLGLNDLVGTQRFGGRVSTVYNLHLGGLSFSVEGGISRLRRGSKPLED